MTDTSKQTYRCAIIGVGRAVFSGVKGGGHQIGYSHARMIKENPRCELVAGADISEENLRAFQERFDVPAGYSDYREMLEKEKPDIVSICTYVGLHEQMLTDCAEAGVAGILLEKPVVHSPAAFLRVDQLVERTGVKICVAHIRRYLPNFERIRKLLSEGRIGTPLLFAAGIGNWDLSEWGSHWLDAFRFFSEDRPVNWVMAQARVTDLRGYGHAMEDHALACFEFANGARGLLDGGKGLGREDAERGTTPPTITVVGTNGTVYLRNWVKELQIYGADGMESIVDPTGGEKGESFENTWIPYGIGMVDWLDGGEPPRTAWPHVRGSAELNQAAYLSILRSDRIDLPLDTTAAEVDEWPVEILARR